MVIHRVLLPWKSEFEANEGNIAFGGFCYSLVQNFVKKKLKQDQIY